MAKVASAARVGQVSKRAQETMRPSASRSPGSMMSGATSSGPTTRGLIDSSRAHSATAQEIACSSATA